MNEILPFVDLWPVFVDATYTGPRIIYRPVGEPQFYEVRLVLVTSDPTDRSTTTFRFNNDAPLQSVYLPYIRSVAPPRFLPPTEPRCTPKFIQTRGLSLATPTPGPTGWGVYKTLTAELGAGPVPSFRHVSFLGTSSPTPQEYVPSACVAEGSTADGRAFGFLLQLENGVLARFLWRQINTGCNTNPCPAGYAAGPVDFFLQSGAA